MKSIIYGARLTLPDGTVLQSRARYVVIDDWRDTAFGPVNFGTAHVFPIASIVEPATSIGQYPMTRPERRYITKALPLFALVMVFAFARWMGWVGE